MEIHQGDVYGFVGANGAGKTTLIRIMAGLAEPTQGDIELFGENRQGILYKQRCRMSGIIETPALDPSLTAQDNLEICQIQHGIKEKGCINKALGKAGFSPDDIKGLKVRDFRKLVKTLNKSGITILISSHLLNELDQIATCYGFVHRGKMVQQISAEDLGKRFDRYMLLKVDNVPTAEKILREAFGIRKLEVVSENTIHLYEQLDKKGKIMKAFAMKEISVDEIIIKGEDLETYYMSLIGKKK